MIWMSLRLKMRNLLRQIDNSSQSLSPIKLTKSQRNWTYSTNLFYLKDQKTRKREQTLSTKTSLWKTKKKKTVLMAKPTTTSQKNRNMMSYNNSISNTNKTQSHSPRTNENYSKESLRTCLEREKKRKWTLTTRECK